MSKENTLQYFQIFIFPLRSSATAPYNFISGNQETCWDTKFALGLGGVMTPGTHQVTPSLSPSAQWEEKIKF